MAYNKSKLVEAAQKLLNQGKVAQAIAEYQQILKHEPRDQVTLMTIGELYIRQGETFQAIDYFERLAQLFVGDGFLTKAIAVYKRIAKLAPEEIRPLEKLADLYVQQGVMSEARPLFLQLAEIHLKNNRQAEAVALLKKLLMAEPDNLRIQIRLADLYQAMGQSKEALEAFVSAAQRALARGDHAESEKLADKALKLEPGNLAAIIVKARVSSTQGNLGQAAQILEGVPELDKGGEPAELLLDLYIKDSKWDAAGTLAQRIFDADHKNFGPMQKLVETLLDSSQGERAMGILERNRIALIDGGEHELVGRLLNGLAEHLPGKIEPLEWLVEMYGRTSDSFRLPDALAHLGDALVAADQLGRAKQVFEQLVDREPESDPAKRKLNDVLRRMGLISEGEAAVVPDIAGTVEITKPAAPKVRPDLPTDVPEVIVTATAAPAAPPEPELDDETRKFIAQSLTDVDLFASYGLTQKAIGLLEAILRRAPGHTPTLEKLLDFVLGAGDDRRTAELAAQLEQIHTKRGDASGAERFGELRRRFQRAAGMSDQELMGAVSGGAEEVAEAELPEITAEPSVPEVTIEEAPAEVVEAGAASPSAAADEVQEVDLSQEWAAVSEDTAQAEEAVEFEIAVEQTAGEEPHHEGLTIPEVSNAETPAGAEEFTIPVEAAPTEEEPATTEAATSHAVAEEAPEEVHELQASLEEEFALAEPVATAETHEEPSSKTGAPQAPEAPAATEESEFEVEQDYELVLEPETLIPAHDQKPPEKPIAAKEPETVGKNATGPAGAGFASDQFLSELANEIDQLGIGQLTPGYSEPAAKETAPSNAAKAPVESGPLKEVFDEFRAELGEMGAEDEDLETHYNLGIAFREMGLLDEAISEFQKVAKANEQGRKFRYAMQCCTLLGLAFMEKGQPSIAAMWYERALNTPDNDAESTLALRYDLGVAQETAGEADAALKSFFQVYAVNIDYRDVGERIAALQKTTR